MAISAAVDASAIARVLGIQTVFKNLRGGTITFLPQRIALIGQGASASVYPSTKKQIASAADAAATYGFGSPIHLAARQLFPLNGDGIGTIPVTVYPLVDDGAGVVSTGDITPTVAGVVAASYIVRVNNIDSKSFVISVGDTVAAVVTAMTAAINAVLDMPIIAVDGTTQVDFTSKWKGTSANNIFIEVIGDTSVANSFAVTQPIGGLVNPDIDPALLLVGNVWESLFLNCLDIDDAATLTKLNTFGEGRWGALTRKPMVAFTGNTAITVANAIVVPDARKTDRINSQLVAPGSNDLPFVVAARQLARIAKVANNDPAHDYGSQDASGLVPGNDSQQWNYAERDQAVKAGSSTTEVKDGVINVSDVVTFFHPDGDPIPAYRYVVDIIKLQTIIFNLDLIFANQEWDGAPLIPDDQPTVNRAAKKPKAAVASVAFMLDSLGLNAIISDPDTAKKNTVAEIDPTNPKRLNLVTTVQLSGNTNIISIDLEFGYLFGSQALAA